MSEINKKIRKIHNIPKRCKEQYLPVETRAGVPLKEAGLHYAGLSELVQGYCIGRPHPFPNHMVIFTRNGLGRLITEKREYLLRSGDLLVVSAGYRYLFEVAGSEWEITWCYLQPLPRWQFIGQRGIILEPTTLEPAVRCAMKAYIRDVRSLLDATATLQARLIVKYIELALRPSFQHKLRPADAQSSLKEQMELLWHKVRETPSAPWSLEMLAKEMKMSIETFQRHVKRLYGTTAWQRVIQLRMDHARYLLRYNDYPLDVIAEKVGYRDAYIFSTAFQRCVGVSPGRYRRQFR
ncbi:MAG: AraC family transcriptional regulator [Lentisphaerae bacterium]|nr:MAG: AraC family transcriptional regulator [Lentisphaerota bacterium]